MTKETLDASRDAIMGAFGVLPGLDHYRAARARGATPPRTVDIAADRALLAEEASEKLGGEVTIDTMRPLSAFDAGGRARALLTVTQALAMARQGEVSPADIAKALELVDWGDCHSRASRLTVISDLSGAATRVESHALLTLARCNSDPIRI